MKHTTKGGFNIGANLRTLDRTDALGVTYPHGAKSLTIGAEYAHDIWRVNEETGQEEGWVIDAINGADALECITYRGGMNYWNDVWHDRGDYTLSGWLHNVQWKDGRDMFEVARQVEAKGIQFYFAGPNEFPPNDPAYDKFIEFERQRVYEMLMRGLRTTFGQVPVGTLSSDVVARYGDVRALIPPADPSMVRWRINTYGGFGAMWLWLGANQGNTAFADPFPENLDRSVQAWLFLRNVGLIPSSEEIMLGELGLDHIEPGPWTGLLDMNNGNISAGWRTCANIWHWAKQHASYDYDGNISREYVRQLQWAYIAASYFSNIMYADVFQIGEGWPVDPEEDERGAFWSHDVGGDGVQIVRPMLDFWATDYSQESVDNGQEPPPDNGNGEEPPSDNGGGEEPPGDGPSDSIIEDIQAAHNQLIVAQRDLEDVQGDVAAALSRIEETKRLLDGVEDALL